MSKTGNPERGELTSYLFIALFFILNSLFFSTSVSAQSEEEMKILRMYFKEEELVIAPTRALKPLSQVAENMSIVTAKEIEAMNAHTVAEVLERVTGMFVEFFGHDFGSDASLLIQGSGPRHVLVLVDGMPWNLMVEGKAVTNSIPVRIIQRIEIIKGPASSSWGSSLGGVINIVTKDTGNNSKPTGSMSASFGEKSTQDYTAEVSGKAGSVGYYLYAGRQDSDGLRNNRYFERDSVYTKINMPVSSDIQFMLTAGYSKLHINYGDLPSYDLTSTGITRAFFTTASVTAELTEDISFEASFYTFKQKFIQNNNELSTGDQYLDAVYDEETIGGSGKFIWRDDIQTAVVGVDISDGNLDQTLRAGQSLQSWRVPETSRSDPGIEKWAVFANDTITIGRFSITPGIRHDHNNVSGDFTSPSLGAVYKLGKHTVLRVSVAKGFTSPPLSFTSGGGLFLDPNPDLKPERVWSYQAGVESWAAEYLRVKATFFHHDMKDALVKELYAAGPPTYNDLYFNKGKIKRDGGEIDVETASFYNISLKTGFAYVHKRLYLEEATSEDNYAYNLTVNYNDNKSLSAQLAGNYIWWDRMDEDMAEYDTFIWDLNLNKKIYSTEKINSEIFLTAHNIFNGSLYTLGDRKNPGRSIEAGLKLIF